MADPLAEQADVGEFRTELAGLDPVNDLDDLVAARCRDTDLAPLCRHHMILDDDLLLKGLLILYYKNCSN